MTHHSALHRTLPGWLILLGALTAIGPFSVDMYLPSFPAIAQGLAAEPALVQRSLSVFLAGMAVGQLLYGPLSDRFGRKPPLYVGLLVYVAASVLCAFAPTIELLVLGRFLQALGASAGVVIARAAVRDRTTVSEGARAFSLLMLVMGLAPIVAPLLGGAVLSWLGWRGIFGLLAAIGAALLLMVALGMSETVSRQQARPLRLGRTLATYGRLLANPRLLGYAMCGGAVYGGMFAYISSAPHVLIEHYGVPPQHFGWLFGLNAAGLIGASQINARLLRRHTPQALLRRALVALPAVGLIALVPALLQVQTLPLLMLALFGFLSGQGFVVPNTTALALAESDGHAGAASALLGALQFLLGGLAGAVVSLWPAADATPLAAVLLGCSALAWLCYALAHRAAPAASGERGAGLSRFSAAAAPGSIRRVLVPPFIQEAIMKLYIKPGACSLAPHIALREAKLPVELVKVDLAAKKLPDGGDFLAVNPKGQVPTLALDDGEILTEVAVVLQYIADRAPATGLLPAAGTLARYHTLEWVNFVATELHKGFSPLFRPTTPEAYKPVAKEFLAGKFGLLDRRLADVPYLAGQQYSIADIYCFVILGWTRVTGIDLGGYANIQAFLGRVGQRPAVREALAAEGLA